MKDSMTYEKGRKLDAIFLLLLLATDGYEEEEKDLSQPRQLSCEDIEKEFYFEKKLKEFEMNKYRY